MRRRGGVPAAKSEGADSASGDAARGAMRLRGARTVLVTGGRDFGDAAAVRAAIEGLDPRPELVIHGGATGADALADRVARELGIPRDPHPARWADHFPRCPSGCTKTFHPEAGPIRNSEMVALRPDQVLAFPGGKGTADCVSKARRAGIPTTVLS